MLLLNIIMVTIKPVLNLIEKDLKKVNKTVYENKKR